MAPVIAQVKAAPVQLSENVASVIAISASQSPGSLSPVFAVTFAAAATVGSSSSATSTVTTAVTSLPEGS